jgi:hypothetical protein
MFLGCPIGLYFRIIFHPRFWIFLLSFMIYMVVMGGFQANRDILYPDYKWRSQEGTLLIRGEYQTALKRVNQLILEHPYSKDALIWKINICQRYHVCSKQETDAAIVRYKKLEALGL